MRDYWSNCITHLDEDVDEFVDDYFGCPGRKVKLIAAAGFDPRSSRVARLLASKLGSRLSATFIREDRGSGNSDLYEKAEKNEAALSRLVPDSNVITIKIFASDGAPIAGSQITQELIRFPPEEDITDIIVDLSALSIGVGFPAARMMLTIAEARERCSFHLMITSNPDLDDCIKGNVSDRPVPIRGFAPLPSPDAYQDLDPVRIWIPQLASGMASTLAMIGRQLKDVYKICPLLPFPSSDPRRSDDLIEEYLSFLLEEWQVNFNDLVYAAEHNPLDTYRLLSRLHLRFDRTMRGTFALQMVLSPLGSKVMAAGAWMAAIEHGLTVYYVETQDYVFDESSEAPGSPLEDDSIVHMLLSGPSYHGF